MNFMTHHMKLLMGFESEFMFVDEQDEMRKYHQQKKLWKNKQAGNQSAYGVK